MIEIKIPARNILEKPLQRVLPLGKFRDVDLSHRPTSIRVCTLHKGPPGAMPVKHQTLSENLICKLLDVLMISLEGMSFPSLGDFAAFPF